MTVMVLGGAGYIGSHMVDRLVAAGKEKVVVVDSLVTGHRAAVNPAAKFYQGDLADQEFMRGVFRENPDIDAVIHFAAFSLVAESMKEPLKYFDNNTAGMVKPIPMHSTALCSRESGFLEMLYVTERLGSLNFTSSVAWIIM